jgi:molecular chaperone GrpE
MNGQAKRPETNMDEQPDEGMAADDTGNASEASEAVDDGESSVGEAVSERDQLQAKADENWDLYLRTAAELQNVQKRAGRDVENAHRFALERFSKELLTVRDSLEMGLAAAENASVESLLEGSTATLKLLGGMMQQFGIEEIDPNGEPFDPEQHEAISMQPSSDVEPGSVIKVVQKGYSLNGRLLRPAMVVVASE